MSAQLIDLSQSPSLINPIVAELRDVHVQGDPLRFRRNIERLGMLMGYEISRTLAYAKQAVPTPLGEASVPMLRQQPVLATVLRAGLPLHAGLLEVFDRADNAFVSAYRKHEDGSDAFEIEIEYLASPDLNGRTLILCDPMLATGSSMVLAWEALQARGSPSELHVVAVIASRQGVDTLCAALPAHATLWVAAIDDTLNDQAYIVPGLGDAGDLAFGEKL